MENVAVVLRAAGLAKVTVPGPLTILQFIVRVQASRQKSVAVPERITLKGNVIVWSGPALTIGGLADPVGTKRTSTQ
jgi:hypothetical protein